MLCVTFRSQQRVLHLLLSLSRALMPWKVLVSNVSAYHTIAMFFHGVNLFALQKIILITNFLIMIGDSVKIERIVVPEVIQSGNSSEAVLDCIYKDVSDNFTLQWLFNGREPPVYEWSPHTEPRVSGILDGRIDLTYRPSDLPTEERRALRIVSLEPELTGDYTCRILDQGIEARQNNSMLVFCPEKDLALAFHRRNWEVVIKCSARGLYPQPEIILELNSAIIAKQQLRLWRSEGVLYDAENTAVLSAPPASRDRLDQITCRLQIPPAGYIAIKKELIYLGQECGNGCHKPTISTFCLLLMSFVIISNYITC